MQDEMNNRRLRRNFREAIKTVLDRSSSFSDKVHFVAQGISRDGYDVYVILQLNKTIYSSYQFLHYHNPEESLRIKKSLSLIESAVSVYLEDCSYRLHFPEAGNDQGPERSANEMLQAAAKNFCFTIAFAGGSSGFNAIYPACNAISLIKYEGKECSGHMIVCRKDHPDLEITLEFDNPFSINQYRKVRKLLELSNDEIGVITDSEMVLGFGQIKSTYTGQKEDIFQIYFRGTNCYDIAHLDQPVLIMKYGVPQQARQLIIHKKFAEDARRIFPGISATQINDLYTLSAAVAQSGKGSMLVFVSDASEEAQRLSKRCITIKPKRLNDKAIQGLASIDGAVIVDLDGIVHAKGVILDGVVGLEGDASRGSRYNSALTYQEFRGWEKPTMIVVVSEDGMVDVVPDLKPAIRHSEIRQFIRTLESLNTVESFNDQAYYNTMRLLKNRAFYLTQEECKQVNALNSSLQVLDRSLAKTMWNDFDDFEPDPRMNEHYYITEN